MLAAAGFADVRVELKSNSAQRLARAAAAWAVRQMRLHRGAHSGIDVAFEML